MDGDYIIDVPEEGKDTTRLSPSGELTAQTTLRQSNASVASIPEFYGSYNTVGFEASFEKDVRKRAEHGVHRIYFSPKENTSDNAVTYSGGLAVQGPINVYASKRYVELPINDEIEKGIYNVRVALKLDHLDIDSIEAIAFYQRYEALEVFTKDDLKLSDTFKSKILVLELHNQLFVEYKSNPGYFIMELRTSTHTLAERDPGYAELHYMWLHTPLPSAMHDGVYGMDGIDGMEGMEDLNDAIVRAHQPFLWSVNVGIKDDTTGPHAPSVPARIISYSASGDGSHVATLSTKDEMLQLDIWDLEIPPHSTLDMDNFNERRAPFLPKPYEPYRIPLKDAKAYSFDGDSFRLSISHDSSKVALTSDKTMAEQDDHNKELLAEYFWLFTFKEPDSSTEKKVLPPQRRLLPVTEDDICPKLKGFSGFGKFHFTSKDRDIKDELFITCNWNAVDIFAVDQKWECIRTIKLAEVGDRIHDANELIDGLSGRYFCWRSGSDILSVCDLETGKLVHSIHSGGTGHLSSDGSMMLCHQFSDTIKTLWTESGTMIGSTDISGSYCYPDPFFIKNNSRVLIPWINPDDLYGRGRLGMIVDATTHSVVERVSYSVGFYEQQTQSTGSQGQYIYSLHGSKLDLIRLQDIVVPPYPQQRQHCGNRCLGELSAVKRPPIAREARGAETTERVSESDLNITVEYRRVTYDEYAIVVSISNDQGESREILQIPPLDFSDVYSDYRFYLDKTNLQLITDCKLVVLVWKLPTTFEGSISLQSAFWMPSFACLDKSVDQIQKLLAPRFSTELKTCHHGHYYVSPQVGLKGSKALPVYSDDLFSLELPRAFSTLFALIQMFEAADNTFQNAILQYVGPYVNRTLEYNHNPETILTVICRNVRRDNHKMINAFLKAIFDQPNVRWVPNPGSGCENPISLLLNVAKTDPQDVKLAQIAISLALTVYKYCIRMAKEEKDRHFLWPVMDSLSRLQVLHQHTDLVLNLLRGLVYFPVEDRSYIVDHGIIASPPSFSWPFRGRKEKSIYDYDNPVLHLDLSPTYKEPNPLHENLSWDLFVASFDMLWRAPEKESEMDTRSPVERIRGHGAPPPPSWIRTLFSIILYKFKSPPHKRVECYKIPLEALDNPAIAALIEYKWNTIGHNYWLARFSWQCLYYILVLVTVFTQVYDGSEGSSLMGVFIAIITMASIFLLLELRQFFHDPGRYIKSPYNLVDLVAFGLPLAASACQIVNITKNENGNTSTLSFSVLFIFLHILFELRVNMNVCHYVAIIISIISKIRIFFLIFASGILAFAIAILHLLRGCPVGGCEMDVQFPSSFPRAVSATYFLLGGMWDPVNENFSNKNKDEWAFNIMMVLYFFFTTILLLNVLIALMNSAYEDGDVTWELVWKESRLRCIEGAETLTYNIPGFRQAHDIFPEKIYYFATHQEQKDYIAKYSKKNKNVLIDTQSHDISDTVDMSIGKNDDSQGSSSAATTAAGAASSSSSPSKTAVLKTIQKGQEALKKQHETNQQELKREMQSQGQVVTHLKDQLQELEKQMADMKEMLAAALAAARP